MRLSTLHILLAVAMVGCSGADAVNGTSTAKYRFDCSASGQSTIKFSDTFVLLWPSGFSKAVGADPTIELMQEIYFADGTSTTSAVITVFVQPMGLEKHDFSKEVQLGRGSSSGLAVFEYTEVASDLDVTYYLAFAEENESLIVLSRDPVDAQSVLACLVEQH